MAYGARTFLEAHEHLGGSVGHCTGFGILLSTGFKIMSFHSILIGTVIGLIASIIGAYLGSKNDENTLKIFFPHKVAG